MKFIKTEDGRTFNINSMKSFDENDCTIHFPLEGQGIHDRQYKMKLNKNQCEEFKKFISYNLFPLSNKQ